MPKIEKGLTRNRLAHVLTGLLEPILIGKADQLFQDRL
jgi:hypothetical protein